MPLTPERLTAAAVAAKRVDGGKRLEVPDAVVPGLWLVVTPKGAKSWSVRYSIAGRDPRFTIGKTSRVTLERARERAREVLALVALGRDPQAEKKAARQAPRPKRGETMTVEALCKEALRGLKKGTKKKLSPATLIEYERYMKVDIVPALGRVPAAQLTRGAIRRWADKKAEDSPYAANRALGALRRFYSFAVASELITGTPFVLLEPPAQEKSSDRVLSEAELWALLRALDQMPTSGSDVVRLLLLTGVRRGMALGAHRREILDLDGLQPRWLIPADRTKSKRDHMVPLSRAAVDVVRRRLAEGGDQLFPPGEARNGRPARSAAKAWRSSYVAFLRRRMNRILREHGLEEAPRWTIHNLRHTARTHMREHLGVADDVAELILGHARPGVDGIYNRAKLLKERRAALADWAKWLAGLPTPTKDKTLQWREAQ